MIAMEVFFTILIILIIVWVGSNIFRYAMKKSGGTGFWFGLSDAWIKADEKNNAPSPTEQPKETKGKEKK